MFRQTAPADLAKLVTSVVNPIAQDPLVLRMNQGRSELHVRQRG